ncbi:MAG: hydrolase, partial [Deltaproteobacteria bacterium]
MLTEDKAVLVVIDIQGKLAKIMADKEATFENAKKMIAGAQALDIPIIVTEQNNLGKTIPEIANLFETNNFLVKDSFSCWGDYAFRDALMRTGKKQVIIVGIEAHICVYQTARDLLNENFQVFVVADGIASRNTENRKIAISRLQEDGAKIVSTEMA